MHYEYIKIFNIVKRYDKSNENNVVKLHVLTSYCVIEF
jgi:hypothetical protein